MGTLDRVIRLVAVAAVLGAYGLGLIGGTLALVLGVAAVVLLLTSLIGTCPAYLPFGLSTRSRRR
ncbi:YgaP family membrane protein [Brevundimonas sp. VNH65]|uniref:YgaP family membrane protein n=1 Tax=Brevundimonas sp. VNH65 TaxID=3400917 RepID=UPI003BFDD1DB